MAKRQKGFTRLAKLSKDVYTCLEWGKYCKQECCRWFGVYLPEGLDRRILKKGEDFGLTLTGKIHTWYMALHGIFLDDTNSFVTKLDRFEVIGNYLRIYSRCDMLTDEGKCEGHPTAKPDICKALGNKYPDGDDSFKISPNCLFRFKRMDYNKGGTEGK